MHEPGIHGPVQQRLEVELRVERRGRRIKGQRGNCFVDFLRCCHCVPCRSSQPTHQIFFICTFLDVDLRGKQSDDLIRGESHIGHAGQNDIGRVCAGCSVRPCRHRNARRTNGRAPGQCHPEQQPWRPGVRDRNRV